VNKKINTANKPAISIIIPVFKEKETINNFITTLSDNLGPIPNEIIVVDGSKDNDTINNICDPSVIKVSSKLGRGQQLNTGAQIANGDILLFLHVDTLLPSSALDDICTIFKEKNVGAGAFDIAISSKKIRYRLLACMISFRVRIFRNPFGDQAHFFRQDYFREIGGYQNIKIMEDLEIMRRIRKRGESIVILKNKVVTSSRRWDQEGIFRGILRNWYIRLRYYLGVNPDKLVKYYNK
jgi:rSAM/selenodomain-associated transferase 2